MGCFNVFGFRIAVFEALEPWNQNTKISILIMRLWTGVLQSSTFVIFWHQLTAWSTLGGPWSSTIVHTVVLPLHWAGGPYTEEYPKTPLHQDYHHSQELFASAYLVHTKRSRLVLFHENAELQTNSKPKNSANTKLAPTFEMRRDLVQTGKKVRLGWP